MKKHFIKTFSTSFTFEAKQNPPEKNFTSWLPYIATIGHSCPGNFKHTLYSKSLEILHITLWDKMLIFAKIHIFNFVNNSGSVRFWRWRGDADTCTIREENCRSLKWVSNYWKIMDDLVIECTLALKEYWLSLVSWILGEYV